MDNHDKNALLLFEQIMGFDTQNPPGHEKPLAEFITGYLKTAGEDAKVSEICEGRANVVARIIGGSGKPLILCGHMDTVPCGDPSRWHCSPVGLTSEGGLLRGRGSSDMKSGLAAMLYAFRQYCGLKEKPQCDILFFGTADEESDGMGARALLGESALKNVAAVVIGEPTGNQIALASKGVLWLDFLIKGRASHAAYPHDGINAVDMAYELAARIEKLCRGYTHKYLTPPSCTITGITGGVKVNMVPDSCALTLDVRTVPALAHSVLLLQINETARALCAGHPGLDITLDVRGNRPAVETCADNETVRRLSDIRTSVCGTPTEYMGTGYFSDASVFVGAGAVPAVLFGPGLPDQAHVPDEYVETDAYLKSVRCYEALIGSCF